MYIIRKKVQNKLLVELTSLKALVPNRVIVYEQLVRRPRLALMPNNKQGSIRMYAHVIRWHFDYKHEAGMKR